MLEAAASTTLFSCKIELLFESNTPSKSYFSRWRKALFVPSRPIQLNVGNTFNSRKETSHIRSKDI
jgi:hypothetical protein